MSRTANIPVPNALAPADTMTVESPIGPLLLVASARGIVRVAFAEPPGAAKASAGFAGELARLGERFSLRLGSNEALDEAAVQLNEYFSGERRSFSLPLDWSLSSGFRLAVQQYLSEIAFGQTRSYREVAVNVGAPEAGRAVGSACAMNPLPVLVPCHRVIRADGSLGGYIGGLRAKQYLLDLERH